MKDILLKRGSSKAIANYVGSQGELVIDTDNQELRLMNGKDSGGKRLRYVVESYQDSNNFYRVYSDGWIEQGQNNITDIVAKRITFMIPFKSSNYYCEPAFVIQSIGRIMITDKTTTAMSIIYDNRAYIAGPNYWYCCGY